MNAPSTSPASTPDVTEPVSLQASPRLMSIDALRGFDMLWIVGAHGFVTALGAMSHWRFFGFLEDQLTHVTWRGMHFYDLIFPLFVFLAGVSIAFSLPKILAVEGTSSAYGRILKRFVLLYVVALFYSGGFSHPWPDIRLMGVLNRIALAYLFTALFFCHLKWRGLAVVCASLLIGYWALMSWMPFPDVRPLGQDGKPAAGPLEVKNVADLNWNSGTPIHGTYELGVNFANYIDQKYLPGKKWEGTWDPEGLLSTIPAIGTCLLGALAGIFLGTPRCSQATKARYLFAAGLAGVATGWLWSLNIPVIKKVWTSSYVLVAGGYSAMFLAAFYQVIEVWQIRKWAAPFVWVGANSITIYVGNNLLSYGRVAERFAGGDVKEYLNANITGGAGDFFQATIAVAIVLVLARFLYQRKIFIRL